MRIWTIQPAGLYEKLKAQHVLFADGRHCLQDFRPPYRWMIGQMRRRLPPSIARFPWWGKVSERGIQATFWELRLKDVTSVTFFTARGRSF